MPTPRPSRRALLAVGLPAVLLVAACGGADSAPAADTSGAAQTRTVEHAMGTTEVPADPERVVVLDTGELDAVVSLGIVPVGATTTDVSTGFPSYLADRLEETEVVGTIGAPDLEAVAALEPDLVLSNVVRDEAVYDQLSDIAPTVMAPDVGDTWKDTLRLAGEALGHEDRAEELLTAYEERAAAVGAAVSGGDASSLEVSVVRFLPEQIRLYGQGSFIGTVLADAGFSRPSAQQTDETFVEASPEQVDLADADVVFTTTYGPAEATPQAAVTAGPLWQGLEAVRAGRVHAVHDDVWMLGIGVSAAGLVLDDVERLPGS